MRYLSVYFSIYCTCNTKSRSVLLYTNKYSTVFHNIFVRFCVSFYITNRNAINIVLRYQIIYSIPIAKLIYIGYVYLTFRRHRSYSIVQYKIFSILSTKYTVTKLTKFCYNVNFMSKFSSSFMSTDTIQYIKTFIAYM